jgi:glutamate-1-semialdehyde aminotransferase
LIKEVIPNAEAVRFSKTGADVTSAAVRLARAFTKRSKVLCCVYHGWHDWYKATTDRNKGIPPENMDFTYTFNYNDINSVLKSLDRDIACVILEPVVFEKPDDNFLKKIAEACRENGSLLIFDEMLIAGMFGSITILADSCGTKSNKLAAGYTTNEVPTTMKISASCACSIASFISGTGSPNQTMKGLS